MDIKSAVVILSGGLDSSTLLYYLHDRGVMLRALSINYGQRHARELQYAARLALGLGIPHYELNLAALRPLMGGSSQTDPTVGVPEGHYAAESMKLTVVPNRNMLLLAAAATWAIALKYDAVAYAAHAGDHTIYPDCRPEFVDALEGAMQLADWHRVVIERPFIQMTKAEIVRKGTELGVPFHETYSCYKGEDEHCGVCGTCTERREAFQVAGVLDPTRYAVAP